MAMHWSDKRAAVALIGAELEKRGWKLYGWHEDQSDSMADYYHPASWDGVAVKGELVACVNVASWATGDSGKLPQVRGRRKVSDCDRCGGKLVDPEAWRLEDAREDPEAFNVAHLRGSGSRSLLPDVVSPLHFINGLERCRKCGGSGGVFEPTVADAPEDQRWPVFQPNPKGASWHVERAGRIIAKGSGVFSCVDHNNRCAQQANVEMLVNRIEAAGAGDPKAMPERLKVDQVTVRPGKRDGFIDVVFPSKPPAVVISALKRAGFRWAPSFGCWYGPADQLPEGVNP